MTRIIAITDIDAWRAAGHSYPATVEQFRNCFRNRKFNGLEAAFLRIGTRILVDEARFVAALRRQNDERETKA